MKNKAIRRILIIVVGICMGIIIGTSLAHYKLSKEKHISFIEQLDIWNATHLLLSKGE